MNIDIPTYTSRTLNKVHEAKEHSPLLKKLSRGSYVIHLGKLSHCSYFLRPQGYLPPERINATLSTFIDQGADFFYAGRYVQGA